jgi:predicted nucleotidyltransferase
MLLKNVLTKYPCEFYVFGSRTKFHGSVFSDLDLVYKSPMTDITRFELQEDLADIPIPFRVDLVRWDTCSDAFKERIRQDLVPIEDVISCESK